MFSQGFNDKILACAARNRSWLCVGLDPQVEKLPAGLSRDARGVFEFAKAIIEATSDLVCANKPNLAFFEALGREGLEALERARALIPPEIPVILDAKRGDIGNTAACYARALFEWLRGDAATVSPYLGTDSVEPFLAFAGKGVIALCLTSNPGAAELQIKNNLHLQIAELCESRWAPRNPNVGLVVGATRPEPLRAIRAICPGRLFLVPGVGAQGGSLEETVAAGAARDSLRLIINASRSILYASAGADFAEAARREAEILRKAIHDAVSRRIA